MTGLAPVPSETERWTRSRRAHGAAAHAGGPGDSPWGWSMVALAGVVRTLALAFWIGGMAALDFIDAPTRFALLDRNQAVRVGQALFERFNRVELALALVALAAALVAQSARWTIWVLVLMLVVVVAQATYLTPAITRLAHGLDFVHRSHDPRYAAIRPLHTAYTVLEIVLFVGGIAVLAAWARPGRR